ncbi:MAG: HipA domain-containing protein [Elusimicrobia bacterium]|nr:HipA domain-containing protein [Elusimicrobiota bacterium]
MSRLFGRALLPTIPFGRAEMPALVARDQGRMSISGVQMKLSARLDNGTGRLESVATGGTYILKPEPERYPLIPQNENLCMSMAEAVGLPVPPHGLLAMADKSLCYVVKRFDRAEDGTKIQQETVFQILGAAEKYAGSLESVGKAIRSHAANVGLDVIDFFERVLFCFLTGNGDMHLKNWALLYHGRDLALAPCYDLVCSRVYIANEEDSALALNGKKNKLARVDFEALAENLGIDPKAAANSFERLRLAQEKLREMAIGSELPFGLRRKLAGIIKARYKRLYGRSAADASSLP